MSRVSSAVESSVIARALAVVAARTGHLYRGSRIAGVVERARAYWSALGMFERRRFVGLALTTAAAVHVALRLVQGPPADWLWLIVPGIGAAQGLLLVMASMRGGAQG